MKQLFRLMLALAAPALVMTACENNGGNNEGNTEPSKFEIVVSDISTTSAYINVVPEDSSVGYYFDVIPERDYNEVDGNVGTLFTEMLDYYKQLYPSMNISSFLQSLLSVGADGDAVTGLAPETTYYAYAVAVNGQGTPLYWQATPFTTLKGGDAAACTFDITVRRVFSTEVEFTIEPSDASVAYWYAVTTVEGYPGDVVMQNEVKAMLEQSAPEYNLSLEEAVERVISRGVVEDLWYELEKDTQYYIYAYAMNADGSAAGPLYKRQFTTAEQDVSDAEIDITTRVFDGAALYASDPETFVDVKDLAVVQFEATPNFSAMYWLMTLGRGDMTDTTLYPDEATMNAMMQSGGTYNLLVVHYYMDWGATGTLLYFAADANMIYGTLGRQLITPSKEQCDDIALYKKFSQQAPMAVKSLNAAKHRGTSLMERKMKGVKTNRVHKF